MNSNVSEQLLAHLLNCGTDDLSILDDIKYDIIDIVDDLSDDYFTPSLNNIIDEVFRKGIEELDDFIRDTKYDIIAELRILEDKLSEIHDGDVNFIIDNVNDKIDNVNDKIDALPSEIIDIMLKYGVEYSEDATRYISELKELDPFDDIHYYENYTDSDISIVRHQDIYRRFYADKIFDIEDKMGFTMLNM